MADAVGGTCRTTDRTVLVGTEVLGRQGPCAVACSPACEGYGPCGNVSNGVVHGRYTVPGALT